MGLNILYKNIVVFIHAVLTNYANVFNVIKYVLDVVEQLVYLKLLQAPLFQDVVDVVNVVIQLFLVLEWELIN